MNGNNEPQHPHLSLNPSFSMELAVHREEPFEALSRTILKQYPDAATTLVLFARQYAQRLPVRQLDFPSAHLLRSYQVQHWLWCQAVSGMHQSCPWPKYDKVFLETLQKKLEDAVHDTTDPV